MSGRELDATIEIVEAPHRISRLLGLLPDGRAYLATWVTLRVTLRETINDAGEIVKLKTPRVEHRTELVILTLEPSGKVKAWGPLDNSAPFPPEWDIRLGYQPPADCLISPAGFKRAMEGARPDAARLFEQLVDIFDRFLDLSFGIADQRTTAKALAVYVLSTWLSDAFAAFPYLWPNGDKGSGKTKTLTLVARLSYLGQVILAGGSYAALRDLSEYGATLCFDDAENLSDPKTSDPDKRALLLAGNRKGAAVPVKEPNGSRGWMIRNVSAYSPKVFSAIRLPDPVLARRTIVVPLVRSADPSRANHDPEEAHYWPHDRRELVDNLWIFGLHYLAAAKRAYESTESRQLTGPGFEPWRPLFATARLIEDAGVPDLVQCIRDVAAAYQREKADFEYPDATRLAVMAVAEIADVRTKADVSDVLLQADPELHREVEFTAASVAERMNALARVEGLVDGDEEFTSARKAGRILDRLRIARRRDQGKQRTRLRTIRRIDALKLYRAYVPSDVPDDGDDGRTETSETSADVQVSDVPTTPLLSTNETGPPDHDLDTPLPCRGDCSGYLLTPESRARGFCAACWARVLA